MSIVVPDFWKTFHDIATNRMSIKKNVLVIFPQPKERKVSKYQAALKEKRKSGECSGSWNWKINIRIFWVSRKTKILASEWCFGRVYRCWWYSILTGQQMRPLGLPWKEMPCNFLQAIRELHSTNTRWHAGYYTKPVTKYAQILTILPILLRCQGQAKIFNFICSNHGFWRSA